MSPIVYRLCALSCQMLSGMPLGTNLDVFTLLSALMSGRFLFSRGAVFPLYMAASSPSTPTGLWDRCAKPTCGRQRRAQSFQELPLPHGEFPNRHLERTIYRRAWPLTGEVRPIATP